MNEPYIRMMTVTEFSAERYLEFKAGKKTESGVLLEAMQKVSRDEKNPKSALVLAGGIANVKRIRLLRQAEDSSPEMKTLQVKYDWKTSPREEVERFAFRHPAKPPKPAKPILPISIPNTGLFIQGTLRLAIDGVKKSKEYAPEQAAAYLAGLVNLRNNIDKNDGLDLDLAQSMLPEVYRLMTTYTSPAILFSAGKNVKMPDTQWQFVYLDLIRSILTFMFYLGNDQTDVPTGELQGVPEEVLRLTRSLGFVLPPG